MTDRLIALQDKLNYTFQDHALLIRALTHSSTGLQSTGAERNYERLEFLGDRVLGIVMAEWLFRTFPDENEGGLAKRHSALVQGRTLFDIALEQDLGVYIIMSEAERQSGGDKNENILSDVLEALLAAMYLDGGLEPARAVIEDWWGDRIHIMDKAPQDPKTELQEWAQARGLPLPVYDIVERKGPDHAPHFTIEVKVLGYNPVSASGASRRHAEKKAAKVMLTSLLQKKRDKE